MGEYVGGMSPAPRPLTQAEMMELAEHNAKVHETEFGVQLRMPAPEFGPGVELVYAVGSPDAVYAPTPEYSARMRQLDRSRRFWQRVDLEALGKVLYDEHGGALMIPWAMLGERDRFR